MEIWLAEQAKSSHQQLLRLLSLLFINVFFEVFQTLTGYSVTTSGNFFFALDSSKSQNAPKFH